MASQHAPFFAATIVGVTMGTGLHAWDLLQVILLLAWKVFVKPSAEVVCIRSFDEPYGTYLARRASLA